MKNDLATTDKDVKKPKQSEKTPEPQLKPTPIEYDPNKKYKWDPSDVFYLSGNEFGILLQSHRAILNTNEARTILLVERANDVIEEALARSVQAGITKEMTEDKK